MRSAARGSYCLGRDGPYRAPRASGGRETSKTRASEALEKGVRAHEHTSEERSTGDNSEAGHEIRSMTEKRTCVRTWPCLWSHLGGIYQVPRKSLPSLDGPTPHETHHQEDDEDHHE